MEAKRKEVMMAYVAMHEYVHEGKGNEDEVTAMVVPAIKEFTKEDVKAVWERAGNDAARYFARQCAGFMQEEEQNG